MRMTLIGATLLSLVGCISSETPIALETVTSFQRRDVAVGFPPEARLAYPRAAEEFAKNEDVAPSDFSHLNASAQSPGSARSPGVPVQE